MGEKMKKNDWKILLQSKLFQNIAEDTLRNLLHATEMEEGMIAKGEVLYDPVHFRRSLAVILRGEALVTKDGGEGHRIIMSTLRSGDIFGMAALFYEDDTFLTEIRAQKNCRLLYLPKDWLEEALRAEPTLAINYITLLSERIHFLNGRIDAFTGAQATDKLCAFLESHATYEDNTLTVNLPYTMTELAKAINVGRASLYRAMAQLTEAGRIMKEGKHITLLDKKRLQEKGTSHEKP